MNSLLTISTFVMMVLFTIGYLQVTMAIDCGPNERESDCAPLKSCQPSCDHPNGTICPRLCEVNSCVCENGFVRDNNNDQCVNPSQCTTNTRKKRQSTCGPNEVESSCASLQQCQPTCDNSQEKVCPTVCSKNPCVCKDGYIRLSKNNMTCVERTQCNTNGTIVCGENEVYDSCPSSCQSSCVEPDPQPCPLVQCSGGCVCKSGYSRNMKDTKTRCVPCPQVVD